MIETLLGLYRLGHARTATDVDLLGAKIAATTAITTTNTTSQVAMTLTTTVTTSEAAASPRSPAKTGPWKPARRATRFRLTADLDATRLEHGHLGCDRSAAAMRIDVSRRRRR